MSEILRRDFSVFFEGFKILFQLLITFVYCRKFLVSLPKNIF